MKVTPTAPANTLIESNTEDGDELPCVETSWLIANGHSSGVLQNYRATQVLCIRGASLPCGTAGHLLRACRRNGLCRLRCYAEVCAERGGCIKAVLPVSRLRLSVNWSAVSYSDEQGSLALTPLSVRPFASRLSPSFLIAFLAHGMIRMGFGGVLDAAVVAADGAHGAWEATWAAMEH
ncbi:hypothetical protein BWQ96_07310 [Gracilariopsis chorda]|uniref:Uncharacterized protein n=1 Tax=Gracilariopsis chorda TaxID=448386 RepID=A0A2V3ILG5_9FLOR|nr:hypothetical protein BWQ96_07310 [Gracilariopsis chorda]|eukprot:PXF42932.1 hypothetical protein BWQ96_07310 [Gracilariopsis chorda]